MPYFRDLSQSINTKRGDTNTKRGDTNTKRGDTNTYFTYTCVSAIITQV